jgi:putative sporulation protein YyaC
VVYLDIKLPRRYPLMPTRPKRFTPAEATYTEEDSLEIERIASWLQNELPQDKTIVYFCVGTNRSTGDSLGPLVGLKLSSIPELSDRVYGTVFAPVHAVNLSESIELMSKEYPDRFVVAIDASLGKFDHVGRINLEREALRPGAGVKKSLPEVGDVCVTGVVNVCGFMEYFVLQNTMLSTVLHQSDLIYEGILKFEIERHQMESDLDVESQVSASEEHDDSGSTSSASSEDYDLTGEQQEVDESVTIEINPGQDFDVMDVEIALMGVKKLLKSPAIHAVNLYGFAILPDIYPLEKAESVLNRLHHKYVVALGHPEWSKEK